MLADAGLSVEDANVATWPDGGALESFRVRAASEEPPDAARLERAIIGSFGEPLGSEPDPVATVSFDDDASPWYTLGEVRAPDVPGLLHAITVGLAGAGADVHSAKVRTVGGEAIDTFALTDRNGRKLDAAMKDAIRESIATGVSTRRRRRSDRRSREAEPRDAGRACGPASTPGGPSPTS